MTRRERETRECRDLSCMASCLFYFHPQQGVCPWTKISNRFKAIVRHSGRSVQSGFGIKSSFETVLLKSMFQRKPPAENSGRFKLPI